MSEFLNKPLRSEAEALKEAAKLAEEHASTPGREIGPIIRALAHKEEKS